MTKKPLRERTGYRLWRESLLMAEAQPLLWIGLALALLGAIVFMGSGVVR